MFKLSAVAVLVAVSACSYADGVDINDLQVRQDQIVQVVTAHDARLTGLETAVSDIATTPGPKGDTGAAGKDGAPGSVSKKQIIQMNKNTSAVNQLYAQTDELIDAHNENVAAIDSNTQRIDSAEQSTNQRFADMGKRVDDNRKRAAVGVASVAAMANIPQVTDSQSFAVGAGVGDYDSQQAVAVGFSARVSQHLVTKVSVGAGSYGGVTAGAGMSWGW